MNDAKNKNNRRVEMIKKIDIDKYGLPVDDKLMRINYFGMLEALKEYESITSNFLHDFINDLKSYRQYLAAYEKLVGADSNINFKWEYQMIDVHLSRCKEFLDGIGEKTEDANDN
jgi:hypothetical protein